MKFEKIPNQPILVLISVEFEMKLSQLKLSKQFDLSHKSYGFTVS